MRTHTYACIHTFVNIFLQPCKIKNIHKGIHTCIPNIYLIPHTLTYLHTCTSSLNPLKEGHLRTHDSLLWYLLKLSAPTHQEEESDILIEICKKISSHKHTFILLTKLDSSSCPLEFNLTFHSSQLQAAF